MKEKILFNDGQFLFNSPLGKLKRPVTTSGEVGTEKQDPDTCIGKSSESVIFERLCGLDILRKTGSIIQQI